jgi:beta-lactamase superfamily II metal-dependent hydrolase
MKFNMKRVIALLATIAMVMSLFAGCSIIGSDDPLGALKDKVQQGAGSLADKIEQGAQDIIGNFQPGATETIENEKISITMLDVGQGLSLLVKSDDEYMLYDGGDRGTSSYVVSYLEKNGVKNLKYVVASHYDSDHLSGLVGVLNKFEVDTVINPEYEADTKIYQSYQSALKDNGAQIDFPSVGDTYKLGNSTITVLAPAKDYGDPNEMSIAMKIQCGQFACVVTGDAETESETDMLSNGINLNADLYVVGHHGSASSSSDKFVQAMSPDYAFLSVGADNDYGHPSDKAMNTLDKYNVNVYRTDVDGVVTCYSDGIKYAFSKELSKNDSGAEEPSHDNEIVEYVLNTSTMKFHFSDCPSVDKMNESNGAVSNKSREELINDGYSPCGSCKP